MKTPGYWQNNGLFSCLLLPAGKLYAAATALRLKLKKTQKAPAPVVCIGNLTAGGTGKTPVALAVAELLRQCGKKPAFVTRGYGGLLKGVMADLTRHTAKDIGDEPMLLAKKAPVAVNPDRYQGALTAIDAGADVLIMDDGFQNPGLFKDLSILVFDGGFGLGNGLPVPAGPLREDFAAGIGRADAAVIIGEDKHRLADKLSPLPVFGARTVALPLVLPDNKALAFAGIGRPEKFYNSLREQGITPIKTIDFPDHHFYTEEELQKLLSEADALGVAAVTTAKDFVKIPPALQPRFKVLEITVRWDDEQAFAQFVRSRI